MEQEICVLTGDLIGSTSLPAGQAASAMAALRDAADDIAAWPDNGPTRFTPYRGDGWQMVLHNPTLSLRAALYMCAWLRVLGKAFSTRIALAQGVETLSEDADLSSQTGKTFVASGRALDAMDKGTTLVWADAGALGAVFRLADALCASWTPAQAKAVALMLQPGKMTHAEVAEQLQISRQAVDQALVGAGHAALRDALQMIETAEGAQNAS